MENIMKAMHNDSDQTTLFPSNQTKGELITAPTYNSILREQDFGRLKTYAHLGGHITSVAAYVFAERLKEESHGSKSKVAKQFYTDLDWSRATYYQRVKIGQWVVDNQEIDTTVLTNKDILERIGESTPRRISQKKLISAPNVPTNSAIFKAQIVALKQELDDANELIDRLRAQRDEAREKGLEILEQLQDAHEEIAELKS
jgi:hypothetical protein